MIAGKHAQLDCIEGIDRLIKRVLGLCFGRRFDPGGECRNGLFGVEQALIDDDATDFKTVVEGILDRHVEPVVDGGIEKAQCESVYDNDRRHGEQHQSEQQSARHARTRSIAAQFATQAPQALSDQADEQHQRE